MKFLFLIGWFSVVLWADSDSLIDYVKAAQREMQMGRQEHGIEERERLGISSIKIQRLAHFSGDYIFTDTHADLLKSPFHTTDISLTDTIDLFNKSSVKIEALRLAKGKEQALLNLRKEQLFLTIVDMIGAYQETDEFLTLHLNLYHEQKKVLKQIESASLIGAIPKIEAERFANALDLFRAKIAQEKTLLRTMHNRLRLYVPNRKIPILTDEKLKVDIDRFLALRPDIEAKECESRLAMNEAKAIQKNWLPDTVMGMAYQQNNDPTANGDNYSIFAGLHFEINAGHRRASEAMKVQALQINSEIIGLRIGAKAQFLKYMGMIKSSEEKMEILKAAEARAESTFERMKTAYFKHYTDFNSYLQTMQSFLRIHEERIKASLAKRKYITILNLLGSGIVYD